jgi:tetratricopeptide (TPR) repeat protein
MSTATELTAKIQRFTAFLQADPDNTSLLLDLGELQHQAGQFDAALARFARAAGLQPGGTAAPARTAAVYLSQHRFADAAALYQDLLAQGETAPALHHNLGIALFYQGRYPEAALQFSAAAQGGLEAPANARYLANCLHHTGQLDEALQAAQQWYAQTDSPDSQAYLSLLYFDNGERDKARSAAEAVLASQPDSVDANAVRGALALEDQDIDTARASFDTVLAQRPDNGRAWLGKGLSQLYTDEQDGALASLQQAESCMPEHAGTIVALGWAQLTTGRHAEAEQTFRRAVEADRGFAEAHGGLAAALVHLQRLDEARQAVTVANRLDPANFGAVYAKAALLKLDGHGQLADRLINRALQQRPTADAPTLQEYLTTFLAQRAPKH